MNQRLRRSPPDVVYTPIDVTSIPSLIGTPEVVAENLEKIRALGINHIFSGFGFPGLPQEKTLRSLELFATEVMPHFKEAPAEVAGS